MKIKKYANNPLQVRLYEFQEQIIMKILSDKEYMFSKGIYSKSDAVRQGLNLICKQYEQENNIRTITT